MGTARPCLVCGNQRTGRAAPSKRYRVEDNGSLYGGRLDLDQQFGEGETCDAEQRAGRLDSWPTEMHPAEYREKQRRKFARRRAR